MPLSLYFFASIGVFASQVLRWFEPQVPPRPKLLFDLELWLFSQADQQAYAPHTPWIELLAPDVHEETSLPAPGNLP